MLPNIDPARPSDSRINRRYLFYCYIYGEIDGAEEPRDPTESGELPAVKDLAAPFSWTVWRPRIWPSLPPGLSGKLNLRFLFRWALHWLHLFAGRGCGVLLVYHRERLAHYSGFTPGYWRFPFIAEDDFQIGDTWTDPAYRGRGLALLAVKRVMAILAKPGRRVWYVVEAINEPSIRVAEKAQFKHVAEGEFLVPWSLKLAGSYVIRRSAPFPTIPSAE